MFNLYNFAAYQLAWFAVVLGAAWGHAWAGTAVALLVAVVHLRLRRDPVEIKLLGAAALVGLVVDTALATSGQVQFVSPWSLPIAPFWMLGLWIAFSTTLNHSLRWLLQRPVVAALGGAVGGPLAYLAGGKLGALSLPVPATALPSIAALWAAAMIAFSLLLRASLPARTGTVAA
jgi:Protein of unknown function (DUF2878)